MYAIILLSMLHCYIFWHLMLFVSAFSSCSG